MSWIIDGLLQYFDIVIYVDDKEELCSIHKMMKYKGKNLYISVCDLVINYLDM